MSERKAKDQLGVEIEIGDIVVVGSNSATAVARVYGFGCYGQPLSEILIGYNKGRKGDNGASYIILKRGGQSLPELEAILDGASQ